MGSSTMYGMPEAENSPFETEWTMPSNDDVEQALKPMQLIFGLTLENIPTMNLRHQYVLKTTSFLVKRPSGTPQPCLDRAGRAGISSTIRLDLMR